MKQELKEIYNENITNKFFLDKKSIYVCMEQSYMLGEIESEEKYNKLKSAFESLLEMCESKTQMEDDWKKEGGLL